MFQGFHTMLGKLRKGQIQLRQTTQVKRRQLKLHEKTHLTLHEIKCIKYKNWLWDLPGGKVVENLPCEVEDVCSIPDQGTKISQTAQHGQEQRTNTTKVTANNNRNKDAGCRPKEDPGPLVVELASGAGGGGAGLPDVVLASW